MVWARNIFALAALMAGATTAHAQGECRQALALGLDISGSVDAAEYRLQMDGLADALDSPGVIDAFIAIEGTYVRLFIYEWAGLNTQRVIVDWTDIADDTALADVAEALRSRARSPREVATALGVAMEFGANELNEQSDCWEKTLDISGDGESNIGPRPRDVKDAGTVAGITVNGLVIGSDDARHSEDDRTHLSWLSDYFKRSVISGSDAFVETAIGFQDYRNAMTRKLLREMSVLAVGMLD